MREDARDIIIVSIVTVLAAVIRFKIMDLWLFPSGTDPANLIFFAKCIATGSYCFKYMPVFPLILAVAMSFIGDPLLTCKLIGAILLSLMSIPTYFLARELFKSRSVGLIASLVTVFSPAYDIMLSWGGYTNILAFIFFIFATIFLYRSIQNKQTVFDRNLMLSMLFSAILCFTHLMAVIFILFIALNMFLNVFRRESLSKLKLINLKLASLLLFSALLLSISISEFINIGAKVEVSGHPTYIPDIASSIGFLLACLITPSLTLTFILYLTLLATAMISLHIMRYRRLNDYLYLSAWILSIALPLSSPLLGVSTDYYRLIFYSIQPIILANMYIVSLYVKGMLDRKLLKGICIVALSVMLVLSSVSPIVLYDSCSYYQKMDEQELQAIKWISENVDDDSLICASSYMAYWIRALTGKRVIQHKYDLVKISYTESLSEAYSVLTGADILENSYLRLTLYEYPEHPIMGLIEIRHMGNFIPMMEMNLTAVVPSENVTFNIGDKTLLINFGIGDALKSLLCKTSNDSITLVTESNCPCIQVKMLSQIEFKNFTYNGKEILIEWSTIPFYHLSSKVNISDVATLKIELIGNATVDPLSITNSSFTLLIPAGSMVKFSTLSNVAYERYCYVIGFRETIFRNNISYIVYWKKQPEPTLLKVFTTFPMFKLVYSNDVVMIFKVVNIRKSKTRS
ncbi:hypothetical protein DRO21_01995 [archaeon]|nr:MAG: hypothetical protein DRO21_01995 [archaeon]HDM23452.1 hypothetical protein [Candidatus Bathyarchaeota archaeon]